MGFKQNSDVASDWNSTYPRAWAAGIFLSTFGLFMTGRRAQHASPSPSRILRRLSLFASVIASLFAIRMLVAPLPVVPLIPGSLVVVRTVLSMVLHQVTPVSMILTVIPIMIIAMITIIDSHLNAPFLR